MSWRKLLLVAGAAALAGHASAQTTGGFSAGQTLTASGLNSALSAKLDYPGALTSMTGTQRGVADASSAAAGQVGEYMASSYVTGMAATSSTPANITHLDLTAGDWAVDGNCGASTGAGATATHIVASISTTSATLNFNAFGTTEVFGPWPAAATAWIATGIRRINVSGSTTVYLVCEAAFSGGLVTFNGGLQARRMR
jgi:hypothetical protein